jgi:putative addiction module component (TIGR02574 family)
MPVAPEALLEQALALSPADRAKLASGLRASLDDAGVDEAEVERLWSEETDRRASQIASGEVELSTWDQVIERVGGHRPSSSAE